MQSPVRDTGSTPVIREQLRAALDAALAAAGLAQPPGGVTLELPRQREHGDWSTNVALKVAKPAGLSPRDAAARITTALGETLPADFADVDVADKGFINFRVAPAALHAVLRDVVAQAGRYGHGRSLAGERINLEFVSANPTGPLHAGGGRWVAVGDALGNILASQGATVHREYYLNDAGTQLDTFGRSLYARYAGGQPPEDGYFGEYLVEMADRLRAALGDDVTEEEAREWGYHDAVRQLQDDLQRIGVHFDTWFSERTLHERGDVTRVIDDLRALGATFEADGATWLRTTEHGDSRDRVLVRSDGLTTYLCNDLAYHRDKFARGWEHLIDIWGADHHGQVKSLQSGLAALGHPGEPEALLGQLVKLVKAGTPVRMSKRAGDFVALADLLDEVDADVCRLTFLLQSIDTPQTLDLDIVTAQSMDNPVYYVQYAHARAVSINRRAAVAGVRRLPILDTNLAPLRHERELDLLRALDTYPDVVGEAAKLRAPHRVTTWVRDFAARFHGFYRDCRVLSDDVALTQARLWLSEAARLGLANALGLLGVGAPEEMARLDADDGP
ncbi:MAG TPA: arginine--tRNA ligase [Acidimicrobiia bacterium]|nr:arginine--tRNA ligase [Acidimicrobiia bacterium]